MFEFQGKKIIKNKEGEYIELDFTQNVKERTVNMD